MDSSNREIESKILVSGSDLRTVSGCVLHILAGKNILESGLTADLYWTRSLGSADFLRLREENGTHYLTTKSKDKGSNRNRKELEVEMVGPTPIPRALMESYLGMATGSVYKIFDRFVLDPLRENTITCYQITNHVYPYIVVEIETTNESRLLELETKVIRELTEQGLCVEGEDRSLYEIFILDT